MNALRPVRRTLLVLCLALTATDAFPQAQTAKEPFTPEVGRAGAVGS